MKICEYLFEHEHAEFGFAYDSTGTKMSDVCNNELNITGVNSFYTMLDLCQFDDAELRQLVIDHMGVSSDYIKSDDGVEELSKFINWVDAARPYHKLMSDGRNNEFVQHHNAVTNVTVVLTQQPYYANEEFYTARGIDADGVEYTINWEITEGYANAQKLAQLTADVDSGVDKVDAEKRLKNFISFVGDNSINWDPSDERDACDWDTYVITQD